MQIHFLPPAGNLPVFPAGLLCLLLSALIVFAGKAETIEGETDTSALRSTSGPWGRLHYYEVVIRPPLRTIGSGLFNEKSIWSFPDLGKVGVKELFDEFNFPLELKTLLYEQAKWSVQGDFTEVEVNDAIIELMTPADRLSLANWWKINHNDFFQRTIANFEDQNFIAISKALSPEMMHHLRSVCFLRGNVLSTFDAPYLLRKLSSRIDKEEFIRTIFTTHSLIVRLEVNPETDFESVIQYWEAGGRNPRVRSIIEGMRSTSGVDSLDIIHLLPPIPRKYLNSFSTFQDSFPEAAPDCFWTAIQFFRPQTSYRTFDELPVEHFLIDDFDEVESPTQFGDLVCLFDEKTREFVHSYIHIADNLVFTKNGGSFVRPWTMSTLDRMIAVYRTDADFHQITFRTKTAP